MCKYMLTHPARAKALLAEDITMRKKVVPESCRFHRLNFLIYLQHLVLEYLISHWKCAAYIFLPQVCLEEVFVLLIIICMVFFSPSFLVLQHYWLLILALTLFYVLTHSVLKAGKFMVHISKYTAYYCVLQRTSLLCSMKTCYTSLKIFQVCISFLKH